MRSVHLHFYDGAPFEEGKHKRKSKGKGGGQFGEGGGGGSGGAGGAAPEPKTPFTVRADAFKAKAQNAVRARQQEKTGSPMGAQEHVDRGAAAAGKLPVASPDEQSELFDAIERMSALGKEPQQHETVVNVRELVATQEDINPETVAGYARQLETKGRIEAPKGSKIEGYLFRGKVYVEDGHHRIAALIAAGRQDIPMAVSAIADLPEKQEDAAEAAPAPAKPRKIPQVHLHGLKVVDVEFKESEHPRAPDGKFGNSDVKRTRQKRGEFELLHEATGSKADVYKQGQMLLLTSLHVPEKHRGRGAAKAILSAATEHADEVGLPMRLNAVPDEGTDEKKLRQLYEQFGFKHTAGVEMVRPPGGSSPAPKASSPAGATAALDLATMKKVGAKPGGSVPGAIYRDASGADWLVKKTSSEDLSRNEVLAGSLYKAAGVAVPELKLVKDGGKQYVGSKMVAGYKPAGSALSSGALPGVGEGFAADAWLANWDAAGLVYDNIGTVEGKPMRIDVGGALLYRGMGQPKGDKFGSTVGEVDTLRDPKINPQNAKAFSKVTPAEIKAGVAKIAAIPDDQVRKMVSELGPRDAAANKRLADTLIARKADLVKRFGTAKTSDDAHTCDCGCGKCNHSAK